MGTSKRRYPVDKYPIYSEAFDRRRVNSSILNPSKIVDIHTQFNDRNALEYLKLQIEGDEEGTYNRPGQLAGLAYIPAQQRVMAAVDEKYEEFKQQIINAGRYPPTVMPPNLRKEQLQAEAVLDVLTEELEVISKMLDEWSEEEILKDDHLMLKYGPRGGGQLRHGFLVEVDHQKVAPNRAGLQVITDERSPYHGMASADYFASVVKPWTKISNKLKNEETKLTHKLYEQGRRDEVKVEWKKRKAELFELLQLKPLFSLKLAGKPRMPSWPKGVKHYLKKDDEKK